MLLIWFAWSAFNRSLFVGGASDSFPSILAISPMKVCIATALWLNQGLSFCDLRLTTCAHVHACFGCCNNALTTSYMVLIPTSHAKEIPSVTGHYILSSNRGTRSHTRITFEHDVYFALLQSRIDQLQLSGMWIRHRACFCISSTFPSYKAAYSHSFLPWFSWCNQYCIVTNV
jgi:hypothetical protein